MGVNYFRLNSGVGRASKKVRTRSDLPPKSEDPKADRNGQKIQGKNTGFNALLNTVSHMWNPRGPIQLMYSENDFFLVRFHEEEDYNKVLVGGAMGLLESFYSSCLLKEIGQTVVSVMKLDIHTDYACRGCFAQLAVCVDLRKSLVSEVRINGQLQRVEYESLPDVCFKCERYGHGANLGIGIKV
ncbi:hypothetical protein PVK06_048406 [Gossypium arboreum]|uniref:DUF4283 domain-containing protein n=1 Tax=Gossypium arboreum TaxID=29729 RepID=A0ABR0MFZ1_GOSAR|nr:hypothetical protein PVK06_048406 [Gossypium arboreum]